MPNEFQTKSDQAWTQGKRCLEEGDSNSAANRVYYSVLQAVLGFAWAKGELPRGGDLSTHKRIFDVAAKYDNSASKSFRDTILRLAGFRVMADYRAEDVPAERLEGVLSDAQRVRGHFIQNCR